MEEEEMEEQQKETPPSGKMYTMQWWRLSNKHNTAVCGDIFNDPGPDGYLDGH